jgi:hypothetical protein
MTSFTFLRLMAFLHAGQLPLPRSLFFSEAMRARVKHSWQKMWPVCNVSRAHLFHVAHPHTTDSCRRIGVVLCPIVTGSSSFFVSCILSASCCWACSSSASAEGASSSRSSKSTLAADMDVRFVRFFADPSSPPWLVELRLRVRDCCDALAVAMSGDWVRSTGLPFATGRRRGGMTASSSLSVSTA